MRTERQRGDWVDPRRGRATLREVWADYERVGMGHLRETTKSSYRNAWRHVDAKFGRWPVAKIEHADVADWVTSLGATSGPDLVRYAHRVLCLVLDHAMRTRRVSVNVARGLRLPRRPPARDRFLTASQVQALAARLGRDGDLVMAMAYLGLRWSELAALKVADLDVDRRRVHVVERATEVGGRMDVCAPKSSASNRYIAIPALLLPMLCERIDGKSQDELVFPAPNGGYLRNRNWRLRSGFDVAVCELDLDVTPHDLRRTFGSLARAAGADLRWVQKAMGHESITTTARIYAHLYDDELDTVAAALDRIGRAQAAAKP
jgi:integrase